MTTISRISLLFCLLSASTSTVHGQAFLPSNDPAHTEDGIKNAPDPAADAPKDGTASASKTTQGSWWIPILAIALFFYTQSTKNKWDNRVVVGFTLVGLVVAAADILGRTVSWIPLIGDVMRYTGGNIAWWATLFIFTGTGLAGWLLKGVKSGGRFRYVLGVIGLLVGWIYLFLTWYF